jgi:hypothetical protein
MTQMQITAPSPLPTAVRRAQVAVVAVAAIHVLALVLILDHRDVIAAAVAAAHPTGDADALTRSALTQSIVPHVVLALLLPLRAARLRGGRPGTRRFLTAILVIQLLAHATLPIVLAELPGYGGWVIAVQAASLVFEVAALSWLWTPAAGRYFTVAPRASH